MSTAERPRISGVIDFGDAVHTWRINELAIGMAYSMLGSWGKQDGYHLRAAQAFFRGYCSSSTSPQLDPTEVMKMKAEIVVTSFACYFLHHSLMNMMFYFHYLTDPTFAGVDCVPISDKLHLWHVFILTGSFE